MTWTAYQVSLRLLSPMHVGYRKLGNLQQTRPYLTGRSLWGALTARLTREADGTSYGRIGDQVDDHLAFTYFYPYTLPKKGSIWSQQWDKFAWPWSNWDKFAWTFLGSYASTALVNGRSAEEGSLHETEFIAPCTREGEQVYLVGYIFETSGLHNEHRNPLSRWQRVLERIQLGSERGYGWGRVDCVECKAIDENEVDKQKCFGYQYLPENKRPQFQALTETCLLAHTNAETDPVSNREVTIEPLVGRVTTGSTAFGKTVSYAATCWVPGGKVTPGETFQIQPKGMWEHFPPSTLNLLQDAQVR